MPTPVIEALVPYGQANSTSSTGSATVTASNSSGTTTSIGGCGCCTPCPTGYLPYLFSTGGLCAGAITNNVPVYLAMEMEFTPISPYTLAGFCLPSGKVFVGDTVCDAVTSASCDTINSITRQATCDGSTFEIHGTGTVGSGTGPFGFSFNSAITSNPYFGSGWLKHKVCGCNSGITWLSGESNTLWIAGKPYQDAWGYSSGLMEYVTHSCSPFSLTIKGTAVKLDNYNPDVPVAYVEITFTEATAPFLGTAPKVNRLELPCVNMTAIPIDRADCNCPEKFVYGCSLHGKCRPNSDLGDGILCCQTCQDFEEV